MNSTEQRIEVLENEILKYQARYKRSKKFYNQTEISLGKIAFDIQNFKKELATLQEHPSSAQTDNAKEDTNGDTQ